MKDDHRAILLGVLCALLCALVGFVAGADHAHDILLRQMVERGVAEYHPQTGEIVWKETK